MRDLEKHKLRKREWYLRNKKLTQERTEKWRKNGFRNTILYIQKIKSDTPCLDCNKFYHYSIMDFDHRNGDTKINNVSAMARNYKLKTIIEEIEKCDVVCANCHRLRTYNRRKAL